ncbi:MAG TPA: DUF1287 domain-containing protein [Pyrinomonadaceae bacterium]|nr:DUF1287 domain-containing protein [Pyrinomonadaceae bacterium]
MQLYNSARLKLALACAIALLAAGGCEPRYEVQTLNQGPAVPPSPKIKPLADNASSQLKQMLDGAIAQAGVTTEYDPAYVALEYPGGDVPEKTGVCSDVVVRAFRKAGIDLQKEVHEDMKAARSEYPTKWGATGTDKNIDHRRVLNLMVYFTRKGKSLPISDAAADYQAGDIVAWELSNGIDHIGIVTNMVSNSDDRYLIVHNIGAGTRIEDVIFAWTIKGHYRFF